MIMRDVSEDVCVRRILSADVTAAARALSLISKCKHSVYYVHRLVDLLDSNPVDSAVYEASYCEVHSTWARV